MVSLLALVAFTLRGLPAVFAADGKQPTEHQVIVGGFASQMDYQPSSYGNAQETWNVSWTGTPESLYREKEDNMPSGKGYHFHAVPGSQSNGSVWVGYTFYGTGIEYWGFWGSPFDPTGQGSINITDDEGNVLISASDVGTDNSQLAWPPVKLAAVENLELGNHTTRLVPYWGTVSFTHVVVTMAMNASSEDINKAQANPEIIRLAYAEGSNPVENSSAPVSYTGTWAPQIDIGSSPGPVSYPRMGTQENMASATIKIPRGTVYANVNGTTNYNHGIFRIEVSPTPPGHQPMMEYWGSTSWVTLNSTLYSTQLDPNESYNFTFTNLLSKGSTPDERFFDLESVTLWKVPVKSSSQTNVGAIAGGVVGGVLGAALIGAIIFFVLRRRRGKKHQGGKSASPIDIDNDVEPTPYVSTPSQHAQVPMLQTQQHFNGTHGPYSPGNSYDPTSSSMSAPPTDYNGRSSYVTESSSDYFPGSSHHSQYGSPYQQHQPLGLHQGPLPNKAQLLQQRNPAGYSQHADAGSLHPMPEASVSDPSETEEAVPPSYNPDWSNSATAIAARSGNLTGPHVPEGSTVSQGPQHREEPQEADIIKAGYNHNSH